MRCPLNTRPIVQNRGWKHVKSKQESMGRAALSFFWNYNTVEMTLLASAVLVNLAGVMFESNRCANMVACVLAVAFLTLPGAQLPIGVLQHTAGCGDDLHFAYHFCEHHLLYVSPCSNARCNI